VECLNSYFFCRSVRGGGGGAPQHYPKTVDNSESLGNPPGASGQRWVPSRSTRRDAASSIDKGQNDRIFRKVRGILNKLTPERFDKLCLELLNVGIDSKVLKGIILLIVDKALEEPKYSQLYAQLCQRLSEDAPNFEEPDQTTFRRLLISKLQDEFENRARNVELFEKNESPLTSDEEEQQAIAKIKMLGNIKFIGELGKLGLIHESILHRCIKTVSHMTLNASALMDQYFGRMQALAINKELPSRIRFLLQNTIELRADRWVPRKAYVDNGPRTINQVRQDAVKELGVFIPPQTNFKNEFFMDNAFMRSKIKFDRETIGGLADMFGQMPGSGIGTGPGVIQDHYSPTFGRHRANPIFNGHTGNSNGIIQPTYENGTKHYNKSNQISLRPAQSFLMNKKQVPKLQPQVTMMPPSAQGSPLGQSPQLGLRSNPPPIQEKVKSSKKAPPTKEELRKTTETIMANYLNNKDVNDAVNSVRDLKPPKHFLSELVSKIVMYSLDRSEEDMEHASTLVHTLCNVALVTSDNLLQGILSVVDQCPKIEEEVPLVKSYLAQFAARAIIAELIHISDLAHQLENGSHFPLFLLCLQQMVKLKDREWLSELFQQSKINMLKMLPEIDQNKDRMLEILEGKGLSFLFPLMKLEKELLKQIKVDPSPQSIYKWIKDNISQALHTDKGFVNILITSFLQYIMFEINPDDDEEQHAAPSKEQLDEEKQLLLSFKPVMQKFLHDHVDLQVSGLYALQVHCNSKGFPKGMLLRYFVHLYDMEIIEEEAFLSWKEDITQEYPGKGKALFQVNQWLTWLETAEEEESEDEDY
uniref:Eukaryotic translation initiation factor 4 gamma 2 n=1 Tax=Neogobius melanostomus TaxID=47308 RepID=A0A8C6SU23_9GOBI